MRAHNLKNSLILASLLGGLVAQPGCSDDDGPSTKDDAGVRPDGSVADAPQGGDTAVAEKTVRVGTTGVLGDLDPAAASDATTQEVLKNLNYALYVYNPNTLAYDPGLASGDPEISDGGKRWKITLRPNLTFADGTALDANAIKYSIDRSKGLGEGGSTQLEAIEEVLANGLEVTFVLKESAGIFQTLLGDANLTPVNKSVYPADKAISSPFSDAAGEANWSNKHIDQNTRDPKKLLGLGPYTLDAIDADTAGKRYRQITLRANPNFVGGKPETDIIVIKFYADGDALAQALRAGEIDIAAQSLAANAIAEFAADKAKYTIVESAGLTMETLLFNHRIPPFDAKAIRQAVARAVDRSTIVSKVFPFTSSPAYSPVPQGMWSHLDPFKTLYGDKPNLTQIKQQLSAAGYNETNKLSFKLHYIAAYDLDKEAAEIKAALDATGVIAVELVEETEANYWAALQAKDDGTKKATHTYNAFVVGWLSELADPDDFLFQLYHSSADLVGVSYDEASPFHTQVTAARSSADIEARRSSYEQAQTRFAEDAVSVPLVQRSNLVVARSGFSVAATGIDGFLDYSTIRKQ